MNQSMPSQPLVQKPHSAEALPGNVATSASSISPSQAETGPSPSYVPALKHPSDNLDAFFAPGQRLDHFELLRLLGKGAFGHVYLAREIALDRLVALKISPHHGNEARNLARLEHDHVVQVFGESNYGTYRFLWMQYIPGTTLAAVVRFLSQQPKENWSGRTLLAIIDAVHAQPILLDPAKMRTRQLLQESDHIEAVCWIGARLAEALAYAHAQGILHRDLKPANILVHVNGRPLLADFNLSTISRHSSDDPFGGTILYMAPEHLEAFHPAHTVARDDVDERSDIYSLGVVIFELLTGVSPFPQMPANLKGSELLETLATQRRKKPVLPSIAGLPIPDMLDRVLRRCLEPDPGQRFQNAGELAQSLEGCRELYRAEKEMPKPGPLTLALKTRPILMGFVLSMLPHILGSGLCIVYNVFRIGAELPDPGQNQVLWLTTGYTGIVFVVTVGIATWVVAPIARTLYRLEQGATLDANELTKMRRYVLQEPLWGIVLSAVGWLPGAGVVPLLLAGMSAEPLSAWVYVHFLISFGIAGMMAMPYNVLAMQYQVLRVIYPRLLAAYPENLHTVASFELRPQARRLLILQMAAILTPLVSAIVIMIAGPEPNPSSFKALTWLVVSLIFFGVLGSLLTVPISNRLHQTIRALMGTNQPVASMVEKNLKNRVTV